MSQVVEVRLGDLGQIEASEEARSDVEYTRSECEVRALRRQVAQIDECQEEASSRGPGQLGGGGHLGDGAIGVSAVKARRTAKVFSADFT